MPDTIVELDISTRKHPRVVFDSLSGPPALSLNIMDELSVIIDRVRHMPDARTLTISGKKSVFLAGGDLKDFLNLDTPEKGRSMAVKMRGILESLEALPIPVIAAITGNAFGGGMELAVACDVRFAARHVKMGFTQARFGLIPGWGGASRLAELIGRGQAFYMMSSARLVDADAALAMGLVDAVAVADEFDSLLNNYKSSVESLSPDAVAAMKRVLNKGAPWSENLKYELNEFTGLWSGRDHKKGLDAFFAKEKPNWDDR